MIHCIVLFNTVFNITSHYLCFPGVFTSGTLSFQANGCFPIYQFLKQRSIAMTIINLQTETGKAYEGIGITS